MTNEDEILSNIRSKVDNIKDCIYEIMEANGTPDESDNVQKYLYILGCGTEISDLAFKVLREEGI